MRVDAFIVLIFYVKESCVPGLAVLLFRHFWFDGFYIYQYDVQLAERKCRLSNVQLLRKGQPCLGLL